MDFALSNCINSGISTVGVLTQYQPLALNEYIGSGQPWDLDRVSGGVMVLPPYQGKDGADWYKGTANAIYQNLNFINRYDPEYVLILSGDHIYKMDYAKMLARHKETGADCTVAVLEVPIEEASRFGILTAETDGRITDFEEKPSHPKSTKASMGIYIFGRAVMEKYLRADDEDETSAKDFGKNVIPAMLKDGCAMYAYPFFGYWKDVGTLTSLWEANMDLLGDTPRFSLSDPHWRIYSRGGAEPPHSIGEGGRVINSMVAGGCEIHGIVENSILSGGVHIGRGAYVKDSLLMSGVRIGEGATVNYSIVDGEAVIGAGATIGKMRGATTALTVIASGKQIGAGESVYPPDETTGKEESVCARQD